MASSKSLFIQKEEISTLRSSSRLSRPEDNNSSLNSMQLRRQIRSEKRERNSTSTSFNGVNRIPLFQNSRLIYNTPSTKCSKNITKCKINLILSEAKRLGRDKVRTPGGGGNDEEGFFG